VGDRLAHAQVGELGRGGVDAQVRAPPALDRFGDERRVVLQAEVVVGRHVEDDVDAAGAQLHDLRAHLGDDAHDHALDRRCAAPVRLVGDQLHLAAVDPRHEAVRPGADGVARQVVGQRHRHDRRDGVREVRQDRRERLAGHDVERASSTTSTAVIALTTKRPGAAVAGSRRRSSEAADRRGVERASRRGRSRLTQREAQAGGLDEVPGRREAGHDLVVGVTRTRVS
jgi:hypothetical protein